MRLAVMEVAVLGNGGVFLIRGLGERQRLLRLHITQTGVLKEVPSKRIAGIAGGFIAGRDPRSAFDEVVLRVERR